MPKRPSFQFYPSDWLRDTALRSCSTGARGLWIDMICYMHEGNPYGHLKVGDKVILVDNLARMVGETLDVVQGWLEELEQAGVYDLTSDGVICSRRMIRDENLRNIRASGGKLGGNPALKDKGKVNLKVVQEDKQIPTPSSSSSSSSSVVETKQSRGTRLPTDWVPTEEQIQFCKTSREDLDPKSTADSFRDFWIAQPGAKGLKLDWNATWRNWVRTQRLSSVKVSEQTSASRPSWDRRQR